MAKYPISVLDGKLGEAFAQVLRMHAKPGARILDPTCGEKHLWAGIDTSEYDITFSDIKPPYNQDVRSYPVDFMSEESYDCIAYDPPYFFGYTGSNDPRREAYGDYCQSLTDLQVLMCTAHTLFPRLLKQGGKVIVKCADQYQVKERKLYLHHVDWINILRDHYDLVDFYIYRHHRMSPTAFQVKDRPCSVIMHTYFIVGQLRG